MSTRTSGAASPGHLPSIVIAGAGIGGMALAIALRRMGYSPLVLERRQREQLGSEGIFLTLAPNGFNALRGLGLAERVSAQGIATSGIALHNEAGRRLGLIDYTAHAGRFGAPSVTIRRGTLAGVLLDAALSKGVDVRFGAGITTVENAADHVVVRTGDQTHTAPMLVAADGLRSTVRRLVMPGLPQPHYNGLVGSGGIVDAESVAPTGDLMKMIFGREAFFGYIKEPGGPVYWFDSYPSPVEPDGQFAPSALLARLRHLHRHDPLDTRAILSAQTAEGLQAYPDYDIASLPCWSSGRVVLMGDAAHAVTPHSGQGASMALEDALVLASCIHTEREPQAAFGKFEALRRQRVEAAVQLGRQGGQQKKAQGWLALRLRDIILPLVLPLGQKAQERLFSFRADLTPLATP